MARWGKPYESNWRLTVTTLGGIVSILLVGVGLIITNAQNRAQQSLTEQGQVTDRFGRAIGQLGSGNLDVRLGGVYALERLMHDSPTDQGKIIQVLSAFAREKIASKPKQDEPTARSLPTDVQAALTVVGTSNTAHDGGATLIDLNHAPLAHAQLQHLYLAGANLSGTVLTGGNLAYAQLAGADLSYAHLTHVNLTGANLTGANLTHADLSHVNLTRADLSHVNLSHVNLTGAALATANLTDASFSGANLTDAVLVGANIPKPSFATANLTRADLSNATISDGYFIGAELAHTKLVDAVFTDADFTGADFTCADIREANLKRVNLSYANLSGATLYGATLTGVSLADTTLTGTYWPQAANPIIPEGWQRIPGSTHYLEQVGTNNPGGGNKNNTLTSC